MYPSKENAISRLDVVDGQLEVLEKQRTHLESVITKLKHEKSILHSLLLIYTAEEQKNDQ